MVGDGVGGRMGAYGVRCEHGGVVHISIIILMLSDGGMRFMLCHSVMVCGRMYVCMYVCDGVCC